jgi:HD superfamily phosphodiesterase
MNFEHIYEIIIHKLENELPDHLTYHSAHHTKYVLAKSIELGVLEGVEGENLEILKTAALFHDTGFLVSHINHESESCLIAKDFLPKYDYTSDDINTICEMIMSTKIPQTPTSTLAQILCDADLYYFGTERYEVFSEKLYHEYKALKILKNKKDWKNRQIAFLEQHSYFTNGAKSILTNAKKLNFEKIKVR